MNWSELFPRTRKSLFLLLDPDKEFSDSEWALRFELISQHQPDGILLGGSSLERDHSEKIIELARNIPGLPIIAFPGDASHVHPGVDGVLFLSLISGRNPEYLITQHVKYGYRLRMQGLSTLPVGYILIDGGQPSAVSYVTQTQPIPADDITHAVHTAIAGEMLGLKAVYLEAGSGAPSSVSPAMVTKVRQNIDIPLITGGGIRSGETARQLYEAGSDVLVVGNGFEEDPAILPEILSTRNRFRSSG